MLYKSRILRLRSQHRASTRNARHATRFVVALILTATAAAACGGSSGGTNSTKAGGQLVWGKEADAVALDPTSTGSGISWELLQLTYERLVGLDGNLRPIPELAESWKQTSPTTYEFNLRKGVKFSNGREMTVDDVVGSLKRVLDPKVVSSWAAQLPIKDVQPSGASQVTVTLTEPRTSFVPALAGSMAAILPMRELKAGTFDPQKELLGTGPFKVVKHIENESWTFDGNPYYWRPGLPKVKKLVVRIMPEDAARAAALRDGSVDVAVFGTPDSVRLLRGQANVKTVVQKATDYYRVDLNAKSSIFADERLRQAVAMSIDRAKMQSVAFGGVGRPTAAVSDLFGACDLSALPFGTPDVQKARQLVAAAGATGKTVGIITLPQVPMTSPMAQVLQQNLQAAGLKARLTTMDVGQVIKRIYSGKRADFDMIVAWYSGFADPAMVLSNWSPAKTPFTRGYLNADPELDKLIDASLATAPGADRTRTLRDTCARIAQDANVIPLLSKDSIVAYRSDRVSAKINPVEGYAVPLRRLAEFGKK